MSEKTETLSDNPIAADRSGINLVKVLTERKNKMRKKQKTKSILAAILAMCMICTACGNKDPEPESESSTLISEPPMTSFSDGETGPEEEDISIYTGKAVENEEDLAIFKFNCTLPEGYETAIDSKEGKNYISPNGSIIVKAQNFKEEFQSLEVFADQGCASIKLGNMMYQADTEFSEPQKTTVGGFEAIKYDYTITAYIFLYETDKNGEQILDDEGNPIITDEKEIHGEYVNRVYYFYSDEDVFYIICESKKENAEAAAKEFDEFIASVSITPPKE